MESTCPQKTCGHISFLHLLSLQHPPRYFVGLVLYYLLVKALEDTTTYSELAVDDSVSGFVACSAENECCNWIALGSCVRKLIYVENCNVCSITRFYLSQVSFVSQGLCTIDCGKTEYIPYR